RRSPREFRGRRRISARRRSRSWTSASRKSWTRDRRDRVAGTALGTLGDMAPKALTGGLVDECTDLFAIGVMVVETVTGAPPYTGATPEHVLTALLRNDYHLPGASRKYGRSIRSCNGASPKIHATDTDRRPSSRASSCQRWRGAGHRRGRGPGWRPPGRVRWIRRRDE